MVKKGVKLTEDHKKKIGDANKISLLGKKHSKVTIEKRRKSIQKAYDEGRMIAYWKGKKLSLSTRKKMSDIRKDKKIPKLSDLFSGKGNPFYGKKHSIENRKKCASYGMKGKKHTKETKEKLKIARTRQVIPNKDTSIEIKLQNELKNRNIVFEPHKSILGQPDIFIEPNLCIFADGDYWHNLPKAKIRDSYVNKELQKQGYNILRFWEHEINNNIKSCIYKIKQNI